MLIFNRAINKKIQSLTTEAVEDIRISPYQGSMKNAHKKKSLHSIVPKLQTFPENVMFYSSCVLFHNNTWDLYSVQNIAAWFFLMFPILD